MPKKLPTDQKCVPVFCRMRPSVAKKLRAAAKKLGRSHSGIVEELVETHLVAIAK
jgi:predicted DNA-binding protein